MADSNERIEKIGRYELHHSDDFPGITEDPFHLVDFLLDSPDIDSVSSAIDIGSSTGIIPILLAARSKIGHITGVEVDEDTAQSAVENVKSNSLEERITIITSDYRDLHEIFGASSFDIAISNPPYIKSGHGRVSTDKKRARARYEELGELRELIAVAKYLLKKDGRLFLIFPYLRYDELIGELTEADFSVVRQVLIQIRDDGPIKHFMVEANRV